MWLPNAVARLLQWAVMSTSTALWILIGVVWLWLTLNKVAGKVAPAQARELVQRGARLVDVRTPREFAAGHIEGAINLPLHDLDARSAELGDKTHSLVLYCRTGMRSGAARRKLRQQGFLQVNDLGAMKRWGK